MELKARRFTGRRGLVVHKTHDFFKGHEIAVSERLRLTEGGSAIHYIHEARGPKGEPVRNQITFTLE